MKIQTNETEVLKFSLKLKWRTFLIFRGIIKNEIYTERIDSIQVHDNITGNLNENIKIHFLIWNIFVLLETNYTIFKMPFLSLLPTKYERIFKLNLNCGYLQILTEIK